jgi:hypothetical protein
LFATRHKVDSYVINERTSFSPGRKRGVWWSSGRYSGPVGKTTLPAGDSIVTLIVLTPDPVLGKDEDPPNGSIEEKS